MNNSKKWYLETGKCVEDALFEFGLTCNFEHLAHSFTIDPSDQTLLKQNVFTAKELAEIKKKALIPFPDLNVSLTEYLAAFNQKSTSGLRKALYNCKWYEDYDENEHASLDWIRRSIDTLLPLYEKKIMNEKHNEQWYQKRIWFMIDTLFEIIPDLRIVRGENSSSSSSARKNIDRGAACFENLARKRMGRRGDFILRYHDIELACGEDKASDNGTNMMQDRGIKCPKMMRDMLWALLDSVKFNQEKSKKLTILGVTTFGLNLYLDWMTIHEGYVCVLVRSKKISMPSTIDSFPSSLSLFASLLSALEVIKSVINVMNANDVYDIELLKPSLKRAYSEDDDESNDAKSWSRIVSASTPEDNGRFRRVSGA
ncbi:hypothetical protein BCV72DRAFT_218518 [Rhizopus microsporus var. microsporus]|nr:hypothetical protein BCV72DRAFT_218518 [Rhizopus microsporus var. microsporus]